MIGTQFLFAVIVAADATIVFGGIPLLRYTYLALSEHATDVSLLLQLLVANMTLLLLCVAAMWACGMLGIRAVRGVFRLVPIVFSRPSRARRTKYPR
jgi:hypothetical protein